LFVKAFCPLRPNKLHPAYILLSNLHEEITEEQVMKVALTVWEGRISPLLDTARSVVIADIEEGRPVSQRDETFAGDSAHEKIARLCALGVEVLVCGAVSRPLADLVSSCGIRLIPFVSGELREVLEAVIAGRMPDTAFSMPGCGCGRGRRFHGRHGSCAENPRGASHAVKPEEEKE
jgi:predicted Fe-Mo cluster-binding NifX family protein